MARKQRLVVSSSGLRPVQRQPATRIRDNFVPGAAARGASSDLEQIAEGLGKLAPNLRSFAVQLQEKRRQEGIRAGRARFEELAQEQEDFGAAMRQGLIDAKDNPFFRAGILESAGQIAADRYGDALRVAHAQLQDKTDFAAFDEMASGLFNETRENLGKYVGNEIFDAAFNHRAQAHRASERENFSKGLSAALLDEHANQLYAQVADVIDIGLETGLTYESIGQNITRLADSYYLQGMNGTLVNQITANALKAAAVELATLDPNNALAALDEIAENTLTGPRVDGRRAALTRTRQGDDIINAARDAVVSTIQRNYRFEDYKQAQAVQAQTDATFQDAMQAMLDSADPTSVDLTPWTGQLAQFNPTAAATLVNLQASLGEGAFRTDEAVYNRTFDRLMHGDPAVTPQFIGGLVEGRLLTVQDGMTLISAYKGIQADGGSSDRDPIFQNTLTDINRAFQDSVGALGGARGEAANRAEASLYYDYTTFKQSGGYQELSDPERVQWLRDRASYWIKYYGGGGTIGSELEGRSVQAFPGAENVDPRSTVVVTVEQIQRWVANPDTRGEAITLAQRYGFPPAQLDSFIEMQLELIQQTQFLGESGVVTTTTTESQ